ncbi:hypothetical protein BOX15_Mlig017595g2, partial [Macrostomum lignano]
RVLTLLSAPAAAGRLMRAVVARRGASSGGSFSQSQTDASFVRPSAWTVGLARFAVGSGLILAGAAAIQRYNEVRRITARPDSSDELAAIRRAFRFSLDRGGELSLRRVSYSRLQELVATGRVDEVHICPADSALYAFGPTSDGGLRCYAVEAAPASSRSLSVGLDFGGQADCNNDSAEQLADRLAGFRRRLAVVDVDRGLLEPPPLRVAWCAGPVLGNGDSSHSPAPLSLETLLTPGSAACIAAWAGVCLRWRLLYLAAPLAVLCSVPVLILREQK